MPITSAGILLWRRAGRGLEVFLVHPGGPFWAKKDAGAWTIPKGEIADGEDARDAARREFREETGFDVNGELVELPEITQKGGKHVIAFAVEGDCDAGAVKSNVFAMEWPPHSGKKAEFPEVDRAEWFAFAEACEKILASQLPLLDALRERFTPARSER